MIIGAQLLNDAASVVPRDAPFPQLARPSNRASYAGGATDQNEVTQFYDTEGMRAITFISTSNPASQFTPTAVQFG